jgi:hypothetical protein
LNSADPTARVLYAPAFGTGTVKRHDSTFYFDDFMLALQKGILGMLAGRPEHFTVKCLPGNPTSLLLAREIARLGVENVDYDEGSMRRALELSSRAVFDYPSSAAGEAERAMVPSLILAYPGLRVRESAYIDSDLRWLRRWSSVGQAVSLVEAFLDGELR